MPPSWASSTRASRRSVRRRLHLRGGRHVFERRCGRVRRGAAEAVPRPSRAQELDRGAYGRSKGRIRIATSCKPQRGNRDCSVSSAAADGVPRRRRRKTRAVYGVSGAVGGSVETAWPPPSPRKTNCPRRRSVPWRVPRLEKFAKFVGGLSFSSVSRGCPRPPGSELVADLSTETWGIATRLSASGRNRQCSGLEFGPPVRPLYSSCSRHASTRGLDRRPRPPVPRH